MLVFKDFAQKVIKEPGWFFNGNLEPVEDSLKRINNWIKDQGVELINIETIMLPYSSSGYADIPVKMTYGNGYVFLVPTFRVWYRTDQPES